MKETTPQKKKMKARRKTTLLDQRPKEAGDDEEETGEEGDRGQGPPTNEEPVREAGPSGGTQEEGEAPLRLENILLKTRVALDMVTEQYTPVFAALQEAGTLLRTDDALKYPARIRKLQRKLLRSREKESELAGQLQGLQEEERESAVLVKGLEEELQRKVAYIEKMEGHVERNEIRIREQEDIIRRIGETSRNCVTTMSQLFQPDGEAQMKARLYDERVGQPGLEGAARLKNVVRDYAVKVENFLVEFRALAEHMSRDSSSTSVPEEEEVTNRGERESTPEHVWNVEPVHMVRPPGVSAEEVQNLREGMEAMGVRPDTTERQEGGPGGHPGGQAGGAQGGESTVGQQVEQPAGHEVRGDRPADPIVVSSPEEQEGQPMDGEPLPEGYGGTGLVIRP